MPESPSGLVGTGSCRTKGSYCRVVPVPPGQSVVRCSVALCLDGADACPPEDCGGPPGYEDPLSSRRPFA